VSVIRLCGCRTGIRKSGTYPGKPRPLQVYADRRGDGGHQRVGLYILLFLLGYYVFSQEEIQRLLQQYSPFLLGASGIVELRFSAASFSDRLNHS
jgi:hypothetical protein